MDEFRSERPKAWNIYSSSDPSPSQTGGERETPWKNDGTSMNAISFGFVATAILISMFLLMAIFEHLFRPTSLSSRHDETSRSIGMEKFRSPQAVSTSYASSDFSVVMPGQQYPTYIAHPAPLPCPCPCPREGVFWPSHQHTISLP